MTQRQKGALYMILSALCFASMQVVVRLSREIPTMEQIFMRNSFVLIVSAIIILRKKGSLFGPAKYQPYLFGRSFFGFLGLITLFYASSHAAQGDVTILNKTSPIWVTILAVIFMKEKLPKIQIPALALSMVGAFIVFRPSFESNPFPLVVAFLSAVTSGVAYTFLSFFKGKVDGWLSLSGGRIGQAPFVAQFGPPKADGSPPSNWPQTSTPLHRSTCPRPAATPPPRPSTTCCGTPRACSAIRSADARGAPSPASKTSARRSAGWRNT